MKLRILGYLGGYPDKGIATSSYLLSSGGYNLLMDLGSGALLQLEKFLDPLQLDAVLLTHYHHDHTADVGTLQYYWQLRAGDKKEPVLPIYGNTKDPLNFGALTFGNFTKGCGFDGASQLDLGPFKVTFLETQHPVPAFAVRIVEKSSGKVLVNTSDTRYFAGLAPFAKGADLLMTDSNFDNSKPQPRWHMTAGECGQIAADAGAHNLLLTHLPQTIDLELLRREAKATAGDIPVRLASDQPVITI